MTSPSDDVFVSPRPPRRSRRLVVALAVVALITVALTGRALAGSGGGSRYRTATVENRSITEHRYAVGTIEPVSQAIVTFPVAGTVATVDVGVGDEVVAGQRLATLDPDALDDALAESQAALDEAELALEQARNGEEPRSGTSAPVVATQEPAASTSPDGAGAPTGTPSTSPELLAAQQLVLDSQIAVDAALADAQTALASSSQICSAVGSTSSAPTAAATPEPSSAAAEAPPTPDAPATTGPGAVPPPTTETTTPSTTTTTTTIGTSPEGSIAACRDALQGVLDAQTVTSSLQSSLAQAADALNALREQISVSSPARGTTGGSSSAVAAQSSTTGPSSADLVAYQAAINAAETQVRVAEQALKQATVVTPIGGTVLAVGMTPGDDVTAASDSARIIVQGDGGFEATVTLGVDDLLDVELGNPATVTPDGGSEPITGQVVSIGVAATSGSTSVTYPVTVALDDQAARGLRSGAVASVELQVARAQDALSVPTTALSVADGRYSVEILVGSEPATTDVEVGAVGSTWTEITGGLEAGQTVVLADLDEPLPGSATEASGGGAGGAGGRGGAGFAPPGGRGFAFPG